MIYYILRPATRLACLLYFRKIFLLNVERVPKKGPLLIVCNHPSAFLEACLLAIVLPRALYFLTRGDFFKNKFFSWFLRQTHQIPIFRAHDGFDKLRTNQGTFAYCYKALSERKAILIFPEAMTMVEKRLRPVQKGAARLAFGALNSVPSLNILPIGVTFSNPTKFRSHATVKCGELIPVPEMKAGDDERVLISELTTRIESAMKELIIGIDKPADEPLFDALQEMAFNAERISSFPIVTSSRSFPEKENVLAEKVNTLSEESTEELNRRISAYNLVLQKIRLTDRSFLFTKRFPGLLRFLLIPISLLFLIGKLIFWLPANWVAGFVNRKIPRPPFQGPVKWAMGFFVLGAWAFILLILGYVLCGIWGLIGMLIWLMLGYAVLLYMHRFTFSGLLKSATMSGELRRTLDEMRRKVGEHIL